MPLLNTNYCVGDIMYSIGINHFDHLQIKKIQLKNIFISYLNNIMLKIIVFKQYQQNVNIIQQIQNVNSDYLKNDYIIMI